MGRRLPVPHEFCGSHDGAGGFAFGFGGGGFRFGDAAQGGEGVLLGDGGEAAGAALGDHFDRGDAILDVGLVRPCSEFDNGHAVGAGEREQAGGVVEPGFDDGAILAGELHGDSVHPQQGCRQG